MARDDEGREVEDTTVIAGGQQAWADVDRPGGGPVPTADAPTEMVQTAGPDGAGISPARPADRPDDAEIAPDFAGSGPSDSAPEGLAVAAPPPAPQQPPGPVLVAQGLGLLSPSGWAFKDIDLTLPPASVAAVVGPSGTGRSSLLLSLSGRMETSAGSLVVAGHSMRDKPSAIRAITSVARIGTLVTPEPTLTVRESVTERCLLEDVDTRVGRSRYEEACAALQYTAEPAAPVASLIGEQATLFALALACVRVSAVIVLDDLDRGVSAAMQQTILDALIRLSRTGPTIVVSTTDRIPVMEADVVLDLTPQDGAMVWRFEPAAGVGNGTFGQLDPGDDQRPPVPPALGPAPEAGRHGDRDLPSDAPTEDLR